MYTIYVYKFEYNGVKYAYVGQTTKEMRKRVLEGYSSKMGNFLYEHNLSFADLLRIHEVLEVSDDKGAEYRWIEEFRQRGYVMLNSKSGNMGWSNFTPRKKKPTDLSGMDDEERQMVLEAREARKKYYKGYDPHLYQRTKEAHSRAVRAYNQRMDKFFYECYGVSARVARQKNIKMTDPIVKARYLEWCRQCEAQCDK